MKAFHRLKRCIVGLALFASVNLTAQALTQNIEASFRPDSANPNMNKFTNDTPQSGVCPGHIPQRCKEMNIFTIRDTAFSANSIRPILPGADSRSGAMFKVPSEWRAFDVVHEHTGKPERVEIRIAGVGAAWGLPRPPGVSAWNLPGPPPVGWDRRWITGVSPCIGTNYIAAGINFALFFWLVPENAGACSLAPGMEISSFWYSHLEYAYELRTPNPLTMSSGKYTGSMPYTLGPNKDFDFGDVMIPTDSQYIFNFVLTVEHTLKVEIPPGGNRVELVPQGGWQAWLNQGRKPTRLFRDQTFNISASSRFKMQMDCQYLIDDTCGLRESGGDVVPLQVAVTLPSGLGMEDGSPVVRLPLRVSSSGSELFQPRIYVDRKPGALHFEVQQESVKQMIDKHSGGTFSGTVTVVWDSDV